MNLTWDGTVNAGSLIAMGGICITLLGLVIPVLLNIGKARQELSEVKKDVSAMQPKVDMILQVQNQQLNDGKRMDSIERRLEHVEHKASAT